MVQREGGGRRGAGGRGGRARGGWRDATLHAHTCETYSALLAVGRRRQRRRRRVTAPPPWPRRRRRAAGQQAVRSRSVCSAVVGRPWRHWRPLASLGPAPPQPWPYSKRPRCSSACESASAPPARPWWPGPRPSRGHPPLMGRCCKAGTSASRRRPPEHPARAPPTLDRAPACHRRAREAGRASSFETRPLRSGHGLRRLGRPRWGSHAGCPCPLVMLPLSRC